jgi:hypothetical protein
MGVALTRAYGKGAPVADGLPVADASEGARPWGSTTRWIGGTGSGGRRW